jgi:hypothetical protein
MISLKESLLKKKLLPEIKAKIPALSIERALCVCLLHVKVCVCNLFMNQKVTLHLAYKTHQ